MVPPSTGARRYARRRVAALSLAHRGGGRSCGCFAEQGWQRLADQGGAGPESTVGLGWDVRTSTGADFDLDASAIMLAGTGKVASDAHFVFFNNLRSPEGSVEHTGDNLTGGGEGDDEVIKVDLAGVPAEVVRIVFPVSIYEAETRGQNFGQVRNAFIRIVNQAGGAEIARYDLSEDAGSETAMVFGELYRNGPDWKFRAVGQGYASGLRGIALDYGVDV